MFLTSTAICQTAKESSLWSQVKDTNTYAAYQMFIDEFPNSKFKIELETNLFNLIKSFPDVKYVLYKDYRLRDNPGVNGVLVTKMQLGEEVKILEKSAAKEVNTIDNYSANDYWYKVEQKNGTSGWTFGAGLGSSNDLFGACNLFLKTFPASVNVDKVKQILQNLDCNYWQMVKKADTKFYYSEYLKNYPAGIYADDASLLISSIDTSLCFYYSQGKEYMNVSTNMEVKISDKEVVGKSSSILVEFSGSESTLTGKRKGKMLILKAVTEISDSDEIVTQDEIYLLTEQGLQEVTPGKDLLLKSDCE